MSHLLPRRLHLRSRVATLPAVKDRETETIPRNRAPIGRRNNLRAMQPLLRHGSHSPGPRQLHRSGRPATITGQHRASPSPGRQHRNGRKHRRRTATQALDMPQLQRGNPRRRRRTRRTRATQRTTNTRQPSPKQMGRGAGRLPWFFVPMSFSNADGLMEPRNLVSIAGDLFGALTFPSPGTLCGPFQRRSKRGFRWQRSTETCPGAESALDGKHNSSKRWAKPRLISGTLAKRMFSRP